MSDTHEPVWTPEAIHLSADDWQAVRRLAAAQHPDMGIGYKLCRMLVAGTLLEVAEGGGGDTGKTPREPLP